LDIFELLAKRADFSLCFIKKRFGVFGGRSALRGKSGGLCSALRSFEIICIININKTRKYEIRCSLLSGNMTYPGVHHSRYEASRAPSWHPTVVP
jgi:hypothetical protein